MIFFDVTKSGAAKHRSGLTRLNERLREELGSEAMPVAWTETRERAGPSDWFLTTELFSEAERPGLQAFLRSRQCRTAAVFADAIPLKHPHITWPQSVARHPAYMKMLAAFDHVWAISGASRDELAGYWDWLELTKRPSLEVLPLGADLDRTPRITRRAPPSRTEPALLCVGILEPRKNQMFLLDVCEELWGGGCRFDLHVVGRVNPHFGGPIAARIRALQRRCPGLYYHEAATDVQLDRWFGEVRATVYPTIAEGCGLPLLESLWHGVPCVCTDLPVLRENAGGGGCIAVPLNDRSSWREALLSVLTDDAQWGRLVQEAVGRSLPIWADAAQRVRDRLK